ncbi:hypothetical protein CDAR_524711 [Caerostris darwini]|uniref:Uncharacterized protein n=1 Tax=Caerostris darwini TaxID=1538125 RepID=A0AAV4R1C6_9ARAC|nr:hypothetical protein CDAR_524711 [Caerostris darwini]
MRILRVARQQLRHGIVELSGVLRAADDPIVSRDALWAGRFAPSTLSPRGWRRCERRNALFLVQLGSGRFVTVKELSHLFKDRVDGKGTLDSRTQVIACLSIQDAGPSH